MCCANITVSSRFLSFYGKYVILPVTPEKEEALAGNLILASSSPRRRELLEGMGLAFQVAEAQVDENHPGEPKAVVRHLAQLKARDVARRFPEGAILGADTLVSLDGQALGKPRDLADAARMLRMLSGRWHEVCTGICLISRGQEYMGFEETRVRFAALTDGDIQRYCASGEPMGKAGAYAIQGRAGMYIPEIHGSYSNVVGLPTALTRTMLMAIGYLL